MMKKNQNNTKKFEKYRFTPTFDIYSLSISERKDQPFRIMFGSLIERKKNYVSIIKLTKNEETGKKEFKETINIDHEYPPTKLGFLPSLNTSNLDLFASSGESLQLFKIYDHNKVTRHLKFEPKKTSKFNAPYTSFSWCSQDLSKIICSSIDSTVTLFDVKNECFVSQLVAHDKEVFDVAFEKKGKNIFITCSADGSIRLFDCRDFRKSTIMYESKNSNPILRVNWNKINSNIVGCVEMNSNKFVLIDFRVPNTPLCELEGHGKYVNNIDFAPHSSTHLCSVGDDHQALIWDIAHVRREKEMLDPILGYSLKDKLSIVNWSVLHQNYIVLGGKREIELVKV